MLAQLAVKNLAPKLRNENDVVFALPFRVTSALKLVHRDLTLRVLGGSHREKSRWTSENVKLLLLGGGANQSCAIKRRGFVIRLVGYDLRDREGWWRARVLPIAVEAVDPQREHVRGVLDAPPGSGELQAFLSDVTMRAFDFAGADRKPFGQGLAVFQLVCATAQIAMACPHRGLVVARLGRFAMGSEGSQDLVQAPRLQCVLSRLHPGFAGLWLRRDRLGGFAQILANMIEINQIAALGTEPFLDLADDPRRAVPDRVNPRIRPEARPDRAGQELSPRRLHTALDPASVDRRSAPLGVRKRNLGLSPRQRLPLALVLLARVRFHDRNH